MFRRFFRLAEWAIEIASDKPLDDTIECYIPNFLPFAISADKAADTPELFSFVLDDSVAALIDECMEHSGVYENTNGQIYIHLSDTNEYTFIIKDLHGELCAVLKCNAEFSAYRCAILGNADGRIYGLSNALMLAFVHSGSRHDTVVIHASMIRHEGLAYCFVAKSGTGKSTQSANWLKAIPDTDLMNDDNPLLRIHNGVVMSYGSPWSGKTPCYRDVSAPLGGIINIMRHPTNYVEPLKDVFAYGRVLPSFSAMKSDARKYREVCSVVERIVSSVGVYNLYCTQYPESAMVCHETVTRTKEKQNVTP